MKDAVRIVAFVCCLLFGMQNIHAFVQETINGTGNAHWTTVPISYAFNARGARDLSLDQEFTAARAAFATWDSVANSNIAFSELASPVTNEVSPVDGVNVVIWIDDASDPAFVAKGLVASTTTTFVVATGQITDADIALNAVYESWTTTGDGNFTTASGPYDVQDVLTHELGHFVGLDHVTSRTSAMFPSTYAGSISQRTLSQDEISAMQFIYPAGGAPAESTISGAVTRSGVGVKRPYIVCYQSGRAVVGALADASGNYTIRRVPPGNYLVRVQPYSTSSAVAQSPFFRQSLNVDVNFLSMIFPNATQESAGTTVTVTAGMNTPGINFAVSASANQNDPFEVDNSSGAAKPISLDGRAHLKHSWPGAVPPGPGDLDWVSFPATSGRLYVIETRNLGLEAQDVPNRDLSSRTQLVLFDQTGSGILAQNVSRNRLESDPGSRIVRLETSTATRFVRISQRDAQTDAAGAGVFYDVSVLELTGPFGAPTVTSVTPPQGTTNGGIVVTVRGTGFLPGAEVLFGGTPGTEEDVQECVSNTDCRAIRVMVPSHAAGAVTVQVTNPDGQIGSLGSAFTYNNQQIGTFTEAAAAAFGDNFGRGPVVCWGDYDGDGDEDLYSPYHAQNTTNEGELWRNNGNGTFTDVTGASGLNTSISANRASCSWADYDNDGDLDLYVVYGGVGASNRLFQNNGASPPIFANVAAAAGVVGNTSFAKTDGAWADYDDDGDLDLYLVYAGASPPNQLFRNNGNGTFAEVAAAARLDTSGQGGRALWADYDNDGRPDLYVLKRSGQPDLLFHNDGSGTFSNVTAPAGIVEGPNCFDAAWADFNNDGYLDLLCIGDSLPGSQPQRLWINQQNGTFIDRAGTAGINGLGRHGTSLAVLDKDNDGDIDVYLGCGFFSGFPSAILDALLENNGANPPVFTNVAGATSGLDETAFPREAIAAGAADTNNDFFTDVLAVGSGSFDDDNYFWRNTSNTNGSVLVRLLGTVTNTGGLGARVVAIPNLPGTDDPSESQCLSGENSPPAIRQEVLGGSRNQSSMELEFGLGNRPIDARWIDCLNVFWPRSGLRQVFTRVAVNSRVDVREDPGGLRVTRVTPPSGTTAGGTQVTVIGFDFDPVSAQVFFDGIAAAIVSRQGSNIIVVTAPANSAGPADVEVRNPGPVSNILVGGYTYIAPTTKITIFANKDAANNAVDLTWASIGQQRYRVRRAVGPTPADFAAGFQTVVSRTDHQDTGKLNDGINYYYLVDEGEP
jgi:hypothetical protein